MLRSIIDSVRRARRSVLAVGAPTIALGAALSVGSYDALGTLPPDVPPAPRVVSPGPDDDPVVVVMSDADASVSPEREAASRAKRVPASGRRHARVCTQVRVTVVSPDGRVETRVVSQRLRQPATTD